MDYNDLLATNLVYQQSVQYTYERDGSNISDHHPVGFTLDVCCSLNVSTDIPPTNLPICQWFKAIPSELESY